MGTADPKTSRDMLVRARVPYLVGDELANPTHLRKPAVVEPEPTPYFVGTSAHTAAQRHTQWPITDFLTRNPDTDTIDRWSPTSWPIH